MSQVLFGGVPLAVNGITPHIGGNGNWFYGDYDSHCSARGVDGNPLGTIIGFMGYFPPAGYLVCDGAEYETADYPELAQFFAYQFRDHGGVNKWGGDGVTTFAVPDMRNLFLRGHHGDSSDELSGDIGELQESSKIAQILFESNNGAVRFLPDVSVAYFNNVQDFDKDFRFNTTKYIRTVGTSVAAATPSRSCFSIRPVNMAVLFCIKYI